MLWQGQAKVLHPPKFFNIFINHRSHPNSKLSYIWLTTSNYIDTTKNFTELWWWYEKLCRNEKSSENMVCQQAEQSNPKNVFTFCWKICLHYRYELCLIECGEIKSTLWQQTDKQGFFWTEKDNILVSSVHGRDIWMGYK